PPAARGGAAGARPPAGGTPGAAAAAAHGAPPRADPRMEHLSMGGCRAGYRAASARPGGGVMRAPSAPATPPAEVRGPPRSPGALFILSDFDGTLAPIAPSPPDARLAAPVRKVLARLAGAPATGPARPSRTDPPHPPAPPRP